MDGAGGFGGVNADLSTFGWGEAQLLVVQLLKFVYGHMITLVKTYSSILKTVLFFIGTNQMDLEHEP